MTGIYRALYLDYGKRGQLWLQEHDNGKLGIYINGVLTGPELSRADAIFAGMALLGWAIEGREWRGPFLDDDCMPEEYQ